MEIETRLALDVLSESKNIEHQRRYSAVIRYINAYGLIPSLVQILRFQPKKDKIIDQISVPADLKEKINNLEIQLELSPNNPEIISELDELYDKAYRN